METQSGVLHRDHEAPSREIFRSTSLRDRHRLPARREGRRPGNEFVSAFCWCRPKGEGQRLHRDHAPHFEELLENGGRELEVPTWMEETLDGAGGDTMLGLSLSLKMEAMTRPRGETTIYSTSQHPIRQTT